MKSIKLFLVCLAATFCGSASAQKIVGENITAKANSEATMSFSIECEEPTVIAEFFLEMPAGISIQKDDEGYFFDKGALCLRSHEISVLDAVKGIYVLVKNPQGANFKSNSGVLLTIPVTVGDVADGVYTVKMKDILLGKNETIEGETKAVKVNTVTEDTFTITVGDATGIRSISAAAEEGNLFDLQGRRVQKAQKGVFIQGGKKIVVK